MNPENSGGSTLKQKATHEFWEFFLIFVYLACFFCAIAAYSRLLLKDFNVSYFVYGVALLNALVIAKVILIGEYAHVGRRFETKPLLYSALYKAFMFSLLVIAFHFLEEMIKQLIHRNDIAAAFHDIHFDVLLGRSVIVFFTFIPLFGFRELGRVLGPDRFRAIVFRAGGSPQP